MSTPNLLIMNHFFDSTWGIAQNEHKHTYYTYPLVFIDMNKFILMYLISFYLNKTKIYRLIKRYIILIN